jgi:hypothetical protein
MLQTLAWLLSPDFGREKLALAALCSVALYVLAGQLGQRLYPGGIKGWLGRLMLQAVRMCHYVCLPAAAIWRGDLYSAVGIPTTLAATWQDSPRLHLVGPARSASLAGLGQGITLAVGLLVVVLGFWTWYANVSRRGPNATERLTTGGPLAWWDAAREAVYAQLLWAFYRGVAAEWTGESVYSVFASLLIVAVSWLLSPWRRQRLLKSWGAALVASDWVLAVGAALIALSVSSLVLLIPLHAVLVWMGQRVLHHLLAAEPQDALYTSQ